MRPELTEEQRAAIDYQIGPRDRVIPPRWLRDRLDDLELMRRCVASAHLGLRRAAAYSPHLTPDLVQTLAVDDGFIVRLLLNENHPDPPASLPLATMLESPFITRFDQMNRPTFPRRGLKRFAGSTDPVARSLVVRDPDSSPDLIERLSRDPDRRVRSAMAYWFRLPSNRLLELLNDQESAASAAANPRLWVEVMGDLLARAQVA